MTDRTVDEVIRIAGTGIGKWWPNPWWPGGNSTFNDCAAFVSWALYGLKDNKPLYTYVPYIMDRAIREGRWTGGKALTPRPQTRTNADGIRRGDIVIFDWRFRGSRDHVGIALQEPRNGGILTRQANNGGGGMGNAYTNDPAADVNYPTQFVLGYYRPAYKTTSTSGGNTSPITEEDDMPNYRQWDQADKEALINDIWGTGVVSIPNYEGKRVGAKDILVATERRAKEATEAGFTKKRDDRLRVTADTLTGGTPGISFDGEVLALLKRILKQNGVDPEEVARHLAPLLDVRELSQKDFDELAKTVNDDADRRQRERLG